MYIKDLYTVVKYLASNFKKDGRITTKDLYAAVKDSLVNDDEAMFKVGVSNAIKNGAIPGFSIRKGRCGGIFCVDLDATNNCLNDLEQKADAAALPEPKEPKERKPRAPKPPKDEDEEPADIDGIEESSDDKLDIRLSKTSRLYAVDRHNWALQRLQMVNDEEIWLSTGYWSTLDTALNGVAKRILDHKLRLSDGVVVDLRGLAGIVNEAKEEILKEIKSCIDNNQKV